MIGKPKPSLSMEIRDLLDGRIGVFHDGLCIKVFHSYEEMQEWMESRFGLKSTTAKNSLDHAIERL